MTKLTDKALLPAGLRDVLPPAAAFEVEVVERLMRTFAVHGYDRVKPPLIEFEESLLQGIGAALSGQTFRLMDPISQRMMGLRPDITMQVARIAATRLSRAPRPLRLSYSGQVLRVKGTQLMPERQFNQVGAEIIGSASPLADVEVVLMAVDALASLGLKDLTVDLGLPTLVPALAGELGLDPETNARLRLALNRKDTAAVSRLASEIGSDAAEAFGTMIAASGPAAKALRKLDELRLPSAARAEREALGDVINGLTKQAPKLALTVDAVELRGFEYHTGVSYTFFALGVRGELGRGGRYRAGNGESGGEPATGLSLFMDTILSALPEPQPPRRLYLPAGTSFAVTRKLRAAGWNAVSGLDATNAHAEARRLRCSHVYEKGKPRPLPRKKER
jgi:ATP phosphoribosyltransferase regulatory subunit